MRRGIRYVFNNRFAIAFLVVLASALCFAQNTNDNEQKPNVVLILADNLGFGDVGCYGSGGEMRGMPTPNIDRLASEGVRLNQFLVETGCTPSRAALQTGRYSIRSGLSRIVVPGGKNQLQPFEYTLGNLFKYQGYSTIYYGKWHLGERSESEPQYFGYDQWCFGFYGSSEGTQNASHMTIYGVPEELRKAGVMYVREATSPKTPSKELFPFDLTYRPKIDNEITDDAVNYVREHAKSDKPFFIFMSMTRPHFPNIPSEEFKGKSRIGDYGDCVMELDHNVGRMMQAIKDAGIEENTIFVFVSDNGPTITTTLINELHVASAGPWRSELGTAFEGSIRTIGMIRWPKRFKPQVAEGMFSIMDFLPTFARILDAKLPTDRPIDGVDQFDYLLGKQDYSNRDHLITFLGSRLVAVRWRQWRIYPVNFYPTDNNPRVDGAMGYMNETAGAPMLFNIEADPRERRDVILENTWVMRPYARIIAEYMVTLKEHPNPPAVDVTKF